MGFKDFLGPAASVIGGTQVGNAVEAAFNAPSNMSKKNYKRQKEFAQNAIQWRVQDAIAAGLHPLAALGMPVASYAPEYVGGGSRGSFQSEINDMGANITRAMTAGTASPAMTPAETAFQGLQLENQKLQNDKLAAEIRILQQPGSPSPVVSGKIGGLDVPDMDYAQRVQNAYDDWVSGALGALKFVGDNVAQDYRKLPSVRDFLPKGSGAEYLWNYWNR